MKSVAAYFDTSLNKVAFKDHETQPEELGPHDLLVEVHGLSVNPVDYKVASGVKGADAKVLGWDAAGVVKKIGTSVTTYKIGDEVFYAGSIKRAGNQSELHTVDERIVGRKPKSLSFEAAAALPLTTITAYEAIFDRLNIPRDSKKSVLILGGAGGVGSIAIQLLRELTSTRVIATASRKESSDWVRSLGAHLVIDHSQPLRAQLEKQSLPFVDYILCFNDTDHYFPIMADLIAPQGRIVSIVENSKPVDLDLLKSKSASFHWEFMFSRSAFQTSDMIEQQNLLNEVSRLVDAGKIKTTQTIDLGALSVETLTKAHVLLRSHRTIGKITLKGLL